MIVRGPRPHGNFYILDKAISEDKRLTWAARGMLIFLLGKPDHWEISPAALVNETSASKLPSGRDKVYDLIKELIETGYCTRQQNRVGGRMGEVDYMVQETPHTAKPEASPQTPLPYPANPSQVSIDSKASIDKKKESARAKIGFDLETASFTGITDQQLHLWQTACPDVNVSTEIVRASCWLLANPAKRPKSAYDRFLNGWLQRADKSPIAAPASIQTPSRDTRNAKEKHRAAWAEGIMGTTQNNTQTGDSNVIDVASKEV